MLIAFISSAAAKILLFVQAAKEKDSFGAPSVRKVPRAAFVSQ